MTRIWFFGTPLDLLTLGDMTNAVRDAIRDKGTLRHTALNVAKLITLKNDAELAADVCASDIVGVDGMGIVLGLKLFGIKNVERVAGVDLFMALLERSAAEGWRPYLLGARREVLDNAMAEARKRYPGLEFAGSHHGYFSTADEPVLVEEIARSGADCLFVAMPTPYKERFLNRYSAEMQIPFTMGVGGSVDVLAGEVSRAPVWMQRIGLEWLHRLIQEPRKMARRYITTNTAYAWLLAKTYLKGQNPVETSRACSDRLSKSE
ncbi:WecB/TagA/CpsF family glycosyltransferase [Qipengyuania sp. CAU 1752]